MTKTIAVDFDGVVHTYSRGWADGTIYDEPVPGAIDALRLLQCSYAVFIHTARDPYTVADWLRRCGFDTVADFDAGTPDFWNNQTVLLVTHRKLPAAAYLDDRAVRFTNWKQAITDLDEALR